MTRRIFNLDADAVIEDAHLDRRTVDDELGDGLDCVPANDEVLDCECCRADAAQAHSGQNDQKA